MRWFYRRRFYNWCDEMAKWTETPLGKAFLRAEKKYLNELLMHLFGYHILHLGILPRFNILEKSPIIHKVYLTNYELARLNNNNVYGNLEQIPFGNDSVDVVVIEHCLEFVENPHEVLREAYRILSPEGHIVVCCFNPWSIWGLMRIIRKIKPIAPWRGQFYSAERISDWLQLLGFKCSNQFSFFYRPPIQHAKTLKKLRLLERLARQSWLRLGGANIIVAKKSVTTLMPIRAKRWSPRTRVVPNGLVNPTYNHQKSLTEGSQNE